MRISPRLVSIVRPPTSKRIAPRSILEQRITPPMPYSMWPIMSTSWVSTFPKPFCYKMLIWITLVSLLTPSPIVSDSLTRRLVRQACATLAPSEGTKNAPRFKNSKLAPLNSLLAPSLLRHGSENPSILIPMYFPIILPALQLLHIQAQLLLHHLLQPIFRPLPLPDKPYVVSPLYSSK